MLDFFLLLAVLALLGLYVIGPAIAVIVGGVYVLEKVFPVPPEQRLPSLSKVQVFAVVFLCTASAVTWFFRYAQHPYLRLLAVILALSIIATAAALRRVK